MSGRRPQTTNERYEVVEQDIDDLKAVFATVRSKDRIEARVRTPGTVISLKVDEGAHVEPGQVLALLADPKLALRIKSLDAQILGLEFARCDSQARFRPCRAVAPAWRDTAGPRRSVEDGL